MDTIISVLKRDSIYRDRESSVSRPLLYLQATTAGCGRWLRGHKSICVGSSKFKPKSISNFSAKLRQKKLIEDKEKALVSSKSLDEKLMLDQLAENGVHLSKLESIQQTDSEPGCLWLCPGKPILIGAPPCS